MSSQNIVNSLDKIFTWITRLFILNVLWLLFTMIGIIVGGIFPATLSVLKIFRLWIMGEKHIPIWSTFKEEYLKGFLKSNTIGWILAFAGMTLYLNYLVIKSMGNPNIIIYAAFYLLILFYVNLVVWSFPQLAHYNGKVMHFFKYAIILGIGKFHYSIAIVIYVFIVLYISLYFPGILPFFTISLSSFGWIWISLKLFNKVDLKVKTLNYR